MKRTDGQAFVEGILGDVEADDAVSETCQGLVAFLEGAAVGVDQDRAGNMQGLGQQARSLEDVSQNHHDPVEFGLLFVDVHDQVSVEK